MEISFSRTKNMVRECEDAQYGKYFDLELILDHLAEERSEMEPEEALLKFLFELSKIYQTPV